MKKIIALILILVSLISICSCSKTYEPQESTAEESKTVMTLSINGKKYDVKYELYRAFFLNYKSEVDGGNAEVWSGENKSEYVDKINSIILDRIVEIYAAFAQCEQIGFNLYSSDVENKIQENIRISVEGGNYGNATIEGYGSYEKYLAALKAANLNYSVQVLLFRYAIAIDALDTHYIGTASSDDIDINMTIGNINYTKEDVKNFYDSDDCARVLRATYQKIISYTPKESAEKLRDKIYTAAISQESIEGKETAVFNAIMSSGNYSNSSEIKNGYVIGKYNLERSYYGAMTEAAFALSEGEVSECIDIVSDIENSYYIIFKAPKSDAHFEANYEEIKYVYLMNYVGEILHGVEVQLEESVSYTEFYNNISHSEIKM